MHYAGLAHGYGSGQGAALLCQSPQQAKNSNLADEQLLTCIVYENIETRASTQEMLSTVTHRLQRVQLKVQKLKLALVGTG